MQWHRSQSRRWMKTRFDVTRLKPLSSRFGKPSDDPMAVTELVLVSSRVRPALALPCAAHHHASATDHTAAPSAMKSPIRSDIR